MRLVGIDPGKTGGIAWITPEDVGAIAMPMAGKEIDLPTFVALLQKINPDKIVIEKQQSMPKQGVSSTFTTGANYGRLCGACAIYSTEIIRPQEWKNVVLKATAKDKPAAIAYCRRVFPTVSLLPTERCKKPSDGMADALCIAEYGRRAFCDGAIG